MKIENWKLKIIFICLSLGLGLLFRFHAFYSSQPRLSDGDVVRLVETIATEPKFAARGQTFTVRSPVHEIISITVPPFPRLHYGDVVRIEGAISQKMLEDGRMLFLLYHPKLAVQHEQASFLAESAKTIRERTRTLYQSVLPPTAASLLMGMVFGAKEQFSDDFWQALQVTGVLHVIAASGMNVTFVAAALLFGFGLFLNRSTALVLGAFGIVFYLFLVGFQPSILRASLMGLLAFGAALLGRQHFAVMAVFVSGYVLLLYKPSFLFDVGFQLSFLATLAIVFLKPLFDEAFAKFGKIGEMGGESVSTTLAAQVGTMPILFGTFGQIGLLSVFVNALVLWTVPLLLFIGSVAALIGLIIPWMGQALLYLALPFLLFFEVIISFFGRQDSLLTITDWNWQLSVGYYLLLCGFLFFHKPRQQALSLEESLKLEKY